MTLKAALSKTLNIETEEENQVYTLLAHSFFMGVFFSFFFSFANGFFLSNFPIWVLPYGYIGSAFTGLVMSFLFIKFNSNKKIGYASVASSVMIGITLCVIGFRVLELLVDSKISSFIIYTFINPILALMTLQYSGIILRSFDLRQGKKLSGILGLGDVLSSLFGFVMTGFIVEILPSSADLLEFGILFLLGAIYFQKKSLSLMKDTKKQQETVKHKARIPKEKQFWGKRILKSSYFTYVFLICILSVLSQSLVDYNFSGVAKIDFPNKIQLTAFFAIFFAIVKAIELIFKAFFVGKIFQDYGLRVSILLLPILLLVFVSSGTALGFTLTIGSTMFFLVISMSKLVDLIFRRSIEEPSFKIFFQLLDEEKRNFLQGVTEGYAKQIGKFSAGLILIAIHFLSLEVSTILISSIILFVVTIIWTVLARKAYGSYKNMIRNKMTLAYRENYTNISMVFSVPLLLDRIQTKAEYNLIYFKLLDRVEPGSIVSIFDDNLLNSQDTHLSSYLLQIASKKYYFQTRTAIEEFCKTTKNVELQNEAAQVLKRFKIADKITLQNIGSYVKSYNDIDRKAAAIWLGENSSRTLVAYLRMLYTDRNIDICAQAIQSSQCIKCPELWDLLIEVLEIPDLTNVAIPVLVAEGEDIFHLLELAFDKVEDKILLKLIIIQIYARIGTKMALEILVKKVNYANREIQIQVMHLLRFCNYHSDEDQYITIKRKIEDEIGFIVWLLSSYLDLKDQYSIQKSPATAELCKLLINEYEQTFDNIFDLLCFIFDFETINTIRRFLQTPSREQNAIATEMLDIILTDNLKLLIMNLCEGATLAEKHKALVRFYPQLPLSPIERLENIILNNYSIVSSWIKAVAITALSEVSKVLSQVLVSQIYGTDELLKETAYIATYSLDPDLYSQLIENEPQDYQATLDKVTGKDIRFEQEISIMQEVRILKRHDMFKNLSEYIRTKIAILTDEEIIEKGDNPSYRYLRGDNVHFIFQGKFHIFYPNGRSEIKRAGDTMGILEPVDLEDCAFEFYEDTRILYFSSNIFYQLATVYKDLTESIIQYFESRYQNFSKRHIYYFDFDTHTAKKGGETIEDETLAI